MSNERNMEGARTVPRLSKVAQLEQQKAEIEEQIFELRQKCRHVRVKHKYASDTGNYDPSCDRYWSEYRCKTCGAKWDVDSKTKEVTRYNF
jgi:hypothetical protein